MPGILTGLLVARHLGNFNPNRMLLLGNVWCGFWLGLAAMLALVNGLELWRYFTLLALASLTSSALLGWRVVESSERFGVVRCWGDS